MQYIQQQELREYVQQFCEHIRQSYSIDPRQFELQNVKRGLRNADGTGVLVGVTNIGSVQGYQIVDGAPVPMPGHLYYRGIDINDIVSAHVKNNAFGYEEVSYLLLIGKLPTQSQLNQYHRALQVARRLPDGFTEDMILKAPSKNVMNKLSRAVLALYSYDPNPDDTSIENVVRQSIELTARISVIVAHAYATKRHYFDGESLYLHVPQENLSLAENFLHMLRRDNHFTPEEAHLLDLMLTIHAEHGGGNNSAFTCRVLSSTGTDTYGAISAAISSLKGPLHGGANQKVMEMFEDVRRHTADPTSDGAVADYLRLVRDKKAGDGSGKIYGLGHAVYTVDDPRAVILKKYARDMAVKTGYDDDFDLMERIERMGIEVLNEKLEGRKSMCANVDMYSGLVYRMLGIPDELFTPLFAIARTAGWCAHRIEELLTGGRIMRPAYRAVSQRVEYVDIADRG
jgi:citrate synthase